MDNITVTRARPAEMLHHVHEDGQHLGYFDKAPDGWAAVAFTGQAHADGLTVAENLGRFPTAAEALDAIVGRPLIAVGAPR